MDTSDLLALARLQCLIEPSNVDYTDSVLLRELNNSLTTKFERLVLEAHANYWIQSIDLTTTQGVQEYRLPPRAIGVSKIELGTTSASSTGFCRMPQCSEDHINLFQSPSTGYNTPERYVMRGDRVFLDPPPNTTYILRIWYYVRPSRLVPAQATTAGLVTAINLSTLALTLSTVPSTYSSVNVATSLASQTNVAIDVVGQGGWRELQVVGALATFNGAGTTVTFAAGTDLTSVQVGDYVRAADQSEWPQLPEDFHRCLVDVSSVKILIQRDFQQKAAGYGQDVSADLTRFSALISPRVQEEPIRLRADLPSLRGGRWWGGWVR